MSAYGIAGLVDGFFKGREIRHGWEDRKDQKKRQAKLDEYTAAEQARAAERHDWARGQNNRVVSEWERQREDDDAYRRASQEALDATEASFADGQAPVDVTTSTMGAPPRPGPTTDAAARLPQAIDATTRRSAAADQFERYFDPSDLGAAPRATDAAPAGPRRADPTPTDTRGPAIQEARENVASAPPRPLTIEDLRAQAIAEARAMQDLRAPSPARVAGNPAVPPMNMPDNPRLQTEGPGPGGGMQDLYDQGILPRRYVEDQLARQDQAAQPDSMAGFDRDQMTRDMQERLARDQPNYNHDWGKGGLGPDAREAANRASAAVESVPGIVGGVVRDAADTATVINNGLNRAVNPVVKYVTGGEDGYEFPMAPIRGRGAPAAAAPPAAAPTPAQDAAAAPPALGAPPRPQAGGPRISNVPPNAPEATKQLAAVADQAMGEASTPAVQAAAAAVARDVPALGAAGNRPYSEKTRERASTAFMDRYMEVGAPIVIKEFLRRGEIDKAQKFQEFLDQSETKKGMKNWARASFAASVGDFDSFATEIMEGYNRLDYFGDDTTIVTDKSGFTDAEGNITKDNASIAGAKIVFRDEKTGRTFEQVYDSPEDIVTMGVTLLAPEEAFEYWMQKTEAAREAALGAAKAAQESEGKMAKDIRDLTDKIVEASKDIGGVAQISRAEARAMAKAEIEAGIGDIAEPDPLGAPEGAARPGPPVLRRP